jgi:hypothetical protein
MVLFPHSGLLYLSLVKCGLPGEDAMLRKGEDASAGRTTKKMVEGEIPSTITVQ